ncbi:MAG: phytanoyl-CoA dioxygenase family protein [Acidimicrobiaceae bacterium]|nr:phytanoyl-CoA dioxygenase family protein [Acidimicrobiaceae bacterium]
MMTPLERVTADVGAERVVEVLRRDGGVVVDGMFDRDTVDSVRASADGYAASVEPGSATQGLGEDGRSFVGRKTVRFSSLAKLCPAFFDVLDNGLLAAVADEILLPVCGGYWLNTAQVMYIGPGEVAQALHRDANNWWEFVRRTWPDAPEITVSAMIGLDDVTEELGATRVVPGTHLGGELARYGDGESVPAELSPGDALLYSGYVLHGGGANTTESRWRKAMHVSFVAGWLTPEEASPLDFAPGELACRSERVRRLLGHASYDPRPHPGGGLWLRHAKEMTPEATRAERP